MSNNDSFHIIAAFGFARVCEDEQAPLLDLSGNELNLDEAFFNVFQNKVRRASRYVKFANYAAHHCLREIDLTLLKSKRVGLYLGTGIGNSPDIVGFTAEIFANHATTISPGSFVNTVSNAGLFYAARQFGVECTTSVVSQETLSFETALLSAAVALKSGEVEIALVGGVDVYHPPRSTMFQRLNSLAAEANKLGEGAAFVALVRADFPVEAALGMVDLICVERVPVELTTSEWILEKLRNKYSGKLYLGTGVDIAQSTLPAEKTDYQFTHYETRQWTGDYSTASAYALAKFVSEKVKAFAGSYHHFNRHHEGLAGSFRAAHSIVEGQ